MSILTQLINNLRALATNSACKLDVLGHDGYTFRVDSTQVSVLKKTNQVSFTSFLQSQNSTSLEAKIRLEVLRDLTNQALERKLPDQKLRTLLVSTDLTQSNSSRSVSVRLLHTASSRSALASSLCGELLARSLTSGRFTSGLLGTSHFGLQTSWAEESCGSLGYLEVVSLN